jgi:hypothetical protein
MPAGRIIMLTRRNFGTTLVAGAALRGARPRWMVDALKKGKKIESFLIKKPA